MTRLHRWSAALVVLAASVPGGAWQTTATQAAVDVPPAVRAAPAIAAPAPGAAATDEIRPLVIVLDTSGSMSEEDEAGTIKLAGAQAALSQVIRQQRPGSKIGLWTYPGGGGCDGGGFEIEVSDLEQQQMIATIKGLEAGGDTPTAEALLATVEELKAAGFSGATILLISDGLSTCEDPCAAAEQVVAEGFDLTVQAAGFQISSDGLDELACIADATGGAIYEATDGDQLEQVVTDATRAELTLSIEGIPTRTPAGSATRVRATVTNDSAIDIENARLALTFTNQDQSAQPVVSAVLPPIRRFGNVHAGETATHEWVVSYGGRGVTGSADWRAAAWGTNAQPKTATGTIEVTGGSLSLADGDGVIGDLADKRIAILGDSYSAGEGAGDYFEGTDAPDKNNMCHKSPHTYLHPLFERSQVELLACSGATSSGDGTFGDENKNVQDRQVDLLRERQDDGGPVAAAFMTVGGNDIGFGPIVAYCLVGHPTTLAPWFVMLATWDTRCSDDAAFRLFFDAQFRGLVPRLRETYRQVYDELNRARFVDERDGDVAPLYVLAYPQVFPEPQWAYRCRGFDLAEIAFANGLVDKLNRHVETAVNGLRRDGYRVQMVTTVQESFLPDNTSCPRPGYREFVNSIDLLDNLDELLDASQKQEFMHPNAEGYAAETNTIIQWSATMPDELPDHVSSWRVNRDGTFWDGIDLGAIARAITPTPRSARATLDLATGEWTDLPDDLRGGQPLEVEVTHAAPGSPVIVSIASQQRTLGLLTADDTGSARATVTLPRRTAAGGHRLVALGFDQDGNPSLASEEVDVARAIPFWLLPLAALTLLSFLAWWWLGRRYRRQAAAVTLSGTP